MTLCDTYFQSLILQILGRKSKFFYYLGMRTEIAGLGRILNIKMKIASFRSNWHKFSDLKSNCRFFTESCGFLNCQTRYELKVVWNTCSLLSRIVSARIFLHVTLLASPISETRCFQRRFGHSNGLCQHQLSRRRARK